MLGDIQFALRILRKTPGFTSVAVLSLALGIGANSAMFSLADALLFRPLPVPSPSRIVTISDAAPDIPVGTFGNISYPDFVDLRSKNKSFAGLTAVTYTPVGVADRPDALPRLRLAQTVSGNFFDVLQVEPLLGRTFSAAEDRVPERDAVAVLAYEMWEQRFSADPKIVGRTVRLNNVEFTIIGVTKKSFGGLSLVVHPDLYIPAMMIPRIQPSGAANPLERRDLRSFLVKARLNPGVSVAQADAEIATLASGLAAAYPATNRNHGMKVRTEVEARVLQSPPNAFFSAILMTVAGLVLIIACSNVANLMLSRARARSREMAVRLAIGASRGRLLRQLLTESMLLSLAAAALGLLIAQYAADYFTRVRFANDLPLSLVVQLDQRVVVFSLIAAVLSAIFFGLAPAIQSSKTDLVPALKSGEASSKRRGTLGRNALVISQVAFSLILLSAATLFVRALRIAVLGSPGFRTDHLLMMTFDPSLVHYSQDKTRQFYKTLTERARQLPGVTNVALAQMVPFDGGSIASENIAPEGYQFPKGRDADTVFSSNVDEHYFDTMGTPIVQGRAILATDTAATPAVAVINEYMAEHYWPNQNPIGKRFRETARDGALVQVVGVARDATYLAIGESRMAFFYTPMLQHPATHMTVLVQTPAEAANLTDPLRNLVRSLDAHQPIYNVRTMREYYQSQGLFGIRLIVKLVTGMGLLGLAMSLVGLYGLVSYSVTRRTREIGIRMAIGAQPADILRFVMRHGITLAVAGVGAGLIACLGTTRLLHAAFTRLTDMALFDVWSFVVLPVALLGVTMLASYLPARRAAAIDPNQALHHD